MLSFTDMGVDKTRCSSSTDTRDVKQVLKTFNSAFMLLLIQKEQHNRSFQPHISVLRIGLGIVWGFLDTGVKSILLKRYLNRYLEKYQITN